MAGEARRAAFAERGDKMEHTPKGARSHETAHEADQPWPDDDGAPDPCPPDDQHTADEHGALACDDFWARCRLVRYETQPPRFELALPDGRLVRGLGSGSFSAKALTRAFIDSVNEFPPLPARKQTSFVVQQFQRLLSGCEKRFVSDEAGDEGQLLADIADVLRAMREAAEPEDLHHGRTLYRVADHADADLVGRLVFMSRYVLESCMRIAASKFRVADFYCGLATLGCRSLGQRRVLGFKGKLWSAPDSLFGTDGLLPAPAEMLLLPLLPLPDGDEGRGRAQGPARATEPGTP